MRIFVAWSGLRSKKIAEALHQWLPCVMNDLSTWVSSVNVHGGTRWREQLSARLKDCDLGILCLTPENLRSDWLLFEAGALAASSNLKVVCPYLLDISVSALPTPLEQFQAVPATKEGTHCLVESIARSKGDFKHALDVFEDSWPTLSKAIEEARAMPTPEDELIMDGPPRVEIIRELTYCTMLEQMNRSGPGTLLCYNVELQTFVNPTAYDTVWGNFDKMINIKHAIFLLSRTKARRFAIALRRLGIDLPNDPITSRFQVREYVVEDSAAHDQYFDRVAFAMYRRGDNPDRGVIYPQAIIFVLTPPFSTPLDSPYGDGGKCWHYHYALSVNGSYDTLNNLDTIWLQQSGIADRTVDLEEFLAKEKCVGNSE